MGATQNTAAEFVALDDGQLMTQIASGSTGAFEALYDRYCSRAYRLARAVCRDADRAEDAVQDAFMSVWRSRATYQPDRGIVATWLLSVVRYRAIDIARRNATHANRRAGEDITESLPESEDLAEQAVARVDAPNLRALLKRLPGPQREVIALAFYGELTHTEIASRLGLPIGTVKGRMRLGLQRLRADIKRAVA